MIMSTSTHQIFKSLAFQLSISVVFLLGTSMLLSTIKAQNLHSGGSINVGLSAEEYSMDVAPPKLNTDNYNSARNITQSSQSTYPRWEYYFFTEDIKDEYGVDTFLLNRVREKNGEVWAVATGFSEDYDSYSAGNHFHFLLKIENDEWKVEKVTDFFGLLPDYTGETTSLAVSDFGDVWFGVGATLLKYKYNTGRIDTFTTENSSIPNIETVDERNQIADIAVAPNGDMYAITFDARIVAYEGQEWKLYDEENTGVLDLHLRGNSRNGDRMLAATENELWVANGHVDHGLVRKKGDEWTEFTMENSELPSNKVSSVIAKEDGHVFVGTWPMEDIFDPEIETVDSGGLLEIKDDTWTIYTIDDILPQESLNRVWVRDIEQGEELFLTMEDTGGGQGLMAFTSAEDYHLFYPPLSGIEYIEVDNRAGIRSMTSGSEDIKWMLGNFVHPVYSSMSTITKLDEANLELLEAPHEGNSYYGGDEFTLKWYAGRRIENVKFEYSIEDHNWYSESELLDAQSEEGYTYTFPLDTLQNSDTDVFDEFSIRVVSDDRPDKADTTGFFSVLDSVGIRYHLRKDYGDIVELYDPKIHGWEMSNSGSTMWPEDDWEDIVYGDQLSGGPWNGKPSDFPAWEFMERAFGEDELEGVIGLRFEALIKWSVLKANGFQGVCHGFAVSSLIGFTDGVEGLGAIDIEAEKDSIYAIENTREVRSSISTLWVQQWGTEHLFGQFLNSLSLEGLQAVLAEDDFEIRDIFSLDNFFASPTETLDEIKDMLERSSPGDYHNHLVLMSEEIVSGAHTILPYKAEQDENDPDIWKVFVYDSNFPGYDTLNVKIDTNDDRWWYGTPTWDDDGNLNPYEIKYEGTKGLFLGDRADNYLTQSALKQKNQNDELRPEDVGYKYVMFSPETNIEIEDTFGNVTSLEDGVLESGIPGSSPIIPDVGDFADPIGYFMLDNEEYEVGLTPRNGGQEVQFISTNQNKIYRYSNSSTQQEEIQRLKTGNSMSVIGTAESSSEFHMEVVEELSDNDRYYSVQNAKVSDGDSITFNMGENSYLEIENSGTSKTVAVEIRKNFGEDFVRIEDFEMNGESSLRIQPEWDDYTNTAIEVLIDSDQDGKYDETRTEDANLIPSSGEREPGTDNPDSFDLNQNYPNPFNPSTKISYEMPSAGEVTLDVYNILGQHVRRLVNDYKAEGVHEVTFNAEGLTSGVYIYRISIEGVNGENFQSFEKMTLVK